MEEKDGVQVAAGADHYYHDDDDKPLSVTFGIHWVSAVDYPNFTPLWATISVCGSTK